MLRLRSLDESIEIVTLKERIRDLECQVERMKCCSNCRNDNAYMFPCSNYRCEGCENYSKWELRES